MSARHTHPATCRWASDHALLVTLGADPSAHVRERVMAVSAALDAASIAGVRNLHPAYCTVLVVLDPAAPEPDAIEAAVMRTVAAALDGARHAPAVAGRHVEIPVCYEAPHNLDLESVAQLTGLRRDDVVRAHGAAEYVVHFLGFVPGFPYMGGLPESLSTPRLATPRRRVPAGSVAIAGSQAGIYPFETPGGWRVLGRTPCRMFAPERTPMALLSPGDRVSFHAISLAQFDALATASTSRSAGPDGPAGPNAPDAPGAPDGPDAPEAPPKHRGAP